MAKEKVAEGEKSLTKAELVEELHKALGWSKADSAKAFDAVFEVVRGGLRKRKTCTVPQFGTFKLQTLAKRKGRNPRTNEPITIASSKTVRFRPSVTLKKEFNPGKKDKK
jgi:DNA-binding protein HU-beta